MKRNFFKLNFKFYLLMPLVFYTVDALVGCYQFTCERWGVDVTEKMRTLLFCNALLHMLTARVWFVSSQSDREDSRNSSTSTSLYHLTRSIIEELEPILIDTWHFWVNTSLSGDYWLVGCLENWTLLAKIFYLKSIMSFVVTKDVFCQLQSFMLI